MGKHRTNDERFKQETVALVSMAMKRIRSIGNLKAHARLGKKDDHIFFSVEEQEDIISKLRGEIDNLSRILAKNHGYIEDKKR